LEGGNIMNQKAILSLTLMVFVFIAATTGLAGPE
jgi:hypothetical protein